MRPYTLNPKGYNLWAMTTPSLWYEPAPRHFDLAVPWWLKMLAVAAATVVAVLLLDRPIAMWARAHPIPNVAWEGPKGAAQAPETNAQTAPAQPPAGAGTIPAPLPKTPRTGDAGRELMFLEQFGQFACSVVVILAVAVLDPQGRRRALAIAIGCLASLALTYLLKDLFGRSRPFSRPFVAAADGSWQWRGPWQMSTAWTSFPSAHTPAAFALAAGLSWFYPRGRALFVTLAVITAAQRVLHTAHYLSDVIAGMGIGVFTARMTLHTKLAGRVIALAPDGARAWWENRK